MSASEKLCALGRMDDEIAASGELYERLPQIVAVVEAAENLRGDAPWTTGERVKAALAALEEALS